MKLNEDCVVFRQKLFFFWPFFGTTFKPELAMHVSRFFDLFILTICLF